MASDLADRGGEGGASPPSAHSTAALGALGALAGKIIDILRHFAPPTVAEHLSTVLFGLLVALTSSQPVNLSARRQLRPSEGNK